MIIPVVLANLVSLAMLLPKIMVTGEVVGANLQAIFYRQGNVVTILGPFIFALITGYVLAREYSDRTINQLFTYPVSRMRILTAKFFVIFTLIVVTTLLSCASVIIVGVVKAFEGAASFDTLTSGMFMNLTVCLLAFGTIPLAAAVSMVAKNVIPTMVLGAFASFVTLILELGHGMKAILFPWATPYLLVREFGEGFAQTGANPYTGTAITILIITFIVSLLFCLIYYHKSEVHSGS